MDGCRMSRITNCLRAVIAVLPFAFAAIVACDLGETRSGSMGREISSEQDAAMVLSELGIAPGPTLASIQRHPKSAGTFGREGLRIAAVYRVSRERADAILGTRSAAWRREPLPAIAMRFEQGPKELAAYSPGAFTRCIAWFAETGKPVPCDDPAFAAAFGKNPMACRHYRAAVLDRNAGTLTVVYKNYY